MQNWIDKYKPTKLDEVIGDKSTIQKINSFMKQFSKKKVDVDKIPVPDIIITGTNGIGKTLIVDLVLEENGFEKVVPDLSSLSVGAKTKRKKVAGRDNTGNCKTIKTYYSMIQNGNVMTMDGNFIKKKRALVFDNVSNISNQKEKEAIKAIIKMNNKIKAFPIFIIANSHHSKIVNDLRKLVTYIVKRTTIDGKKVNSKLTNEIILRPPSCMDMQGFIRKIATAENLTFIKRNTDEEDIVIEIIEHSQFDVRRLVNILEELKLIYQKKGVNSTMLHDYFDSSKMKDIDPGIFAATSMILNGYKGIDEIILLYGEERAAIPLMIHENYPLNIRQQYPRISVNDKINMMCDISRSISESDKVDGIIYSNQCWNLQSVHGFYSCVQPSFIINKVPGKMCNKESYVYTQDYSKTSIKKINNKVIKKAREHTAFKKVSIYDFLYMSHILKILLINKDYDTVVNLMKPYNLKLKEIESIIKIDKLEKYKSLITGKPKAQLKEMLGVDE